MHKTCNPFPLHNTFAALISLRCDTESAVTACRCLILCHMKPTTSFLKYCITAGVWEASMAGRKPKDDLLLSETDVETL